MIRILVPYADWPTALDLPDGVRADVWDGSGDPPDTLAGVELFVPPYLAGTGPLGVIPAMTALRVVQTLTAGVDDIRPHIPEGVTLCNAHGVHDASTAELAVALALAALRGIPDYVRAAEHGRWAHDSRSSLADRRVLIVGYGAVGAAVEARLAGFEVEVRRVARHARDGVSSFESLASLLPWAEVVVLTVPMTDETRGLVDAGFLAALPDGALVVNVSRGPVVVTDDLLAEVSAGRLLAALDVTDPEPPPADHPLWHTPGVLISPHVGGDTTAFLPRARALVAAQIARYAAGEPLANVISSAY
jgi:phosphoglycerate dehydrogenase-like enzyme